MRPFTRLEAIAAPLDVPNVDTDRIVPARFLRKPKNPEYARYLFHDVRFDTDGTPRGDFVLNQPAFRDAKILVAAENFGCGSSREMAVWALDAYGIRAVVAPSLGDIFHQNCFKNGVLPVILAADTVAGFRTQLQARPGAMMTVDLEAQTVVGPDGRPHGFDIDPFRKELLLTGRDELGLTLGYERAIAAFEARQRDQMSWLPPSGRRFAST
jgi:3-isopropylmalate/(R)-2-methylmalate dehydratase small subunit